MGSTSPRRLAGPEIDAQGADRDDRRRQRQTTASNHRTEASQKLSEIERLDQVVVGAAVKAGDPRIDGIPGGQHQDRDVGSRASNLLADLEAVEARQHDIQQDSVEVSDRGLIQRVASAPGEIDRVRLFAQALCQHLSRPRLILDQQDPHRKRSLSILVQPPLSTTSQENGTTSAHGKVSRFVIARLALALTAWTERWIPDAFIFALAGTVLVFAAALGATPSTLPQVVDAWGRGFWELIPFTLQMALVIITGHVLATSPPMGRLIRVIAGWPTTPRGAVAMVTLFALASSWLNWGFSLIFSAVLAREVARRVEGVDYRALAAASFLGIGSIWAQGLSGSAALQMATPGALQPQIRDIVAHGGVVPGGIISFRHTIFLWQSIVSVVVEMIVVTLVMWLATPPLGKGRTARDLGIDLGPTHFGVSHENTQHETDESFSCFRLSWQPDVRRSRPANGSNIRRC